MFTAVNTQGVWECCEKDEGEVGMGVGEGRDSGWWELSWGGRLDLLGLGFINP